MSAPGSSAGSSRLLRCAGAEGCNCSRCGCNARSIVAALIFKSDAPYLGCQSQMAMALHRLDQRRDDRLQALAANPVRCLPQHDQRLALGRSVNAPRRPWRRPLGRWPSAQHAHRVLAVIARRGRELVDDRRFCLARLLALYRSLTAASSSSLVAMLTRLITALRPAPVVGATQARQRS